ncbi:MAG: hypothetical protein ABIH22_02630 [Candidatus Margulisiibacteriota bacterium]
MGSNEINTICKSTGVDIPKLPKGKNASQISSAGKKAQEEVGLLRELEWVFSMLKDLEGIYDDVMPSLGDYGKSGGLTDDKGWIAWSEATKELLGEIGVNEPGKLDAEKLTREAKRLSFEAQILKTLEILRKKQDQSKDRKTRAAYEGDIAILASVYKKTVKPLFDSIRTAFKEGKFKVKDVSIDMHFATDVYKGMHINDKHSYKPIFRRISEKIRTKIGENENIDIPEINWLSPTTKDIEAVQAAIGKSCGVYAGSIQDLYPKAKPDIKEVPSPTIPDDWLKEDGPKPLKWNLDGGLLPAYLAYWNADGARDDRASMRYEGRVGVRFSDDYKLQLDYRGQIDYNPFGPNAEGKLQPFTSEGFHDRFALSLQVPYNFVVQGTYVQERLGDKEQFMGALGVGYKHEHLDGAAVFFPQAGGILGSSEDGEIFGGGYAALNYSYLFSDPKIKLSGTGFYNLLKRAEFDALGHQFGGSLDLKWAPRPDAHCLLGLAGGVVVNKGVYDSVGVYVGPTLELNFMELINPSEDIIPPVVRGGSY